MTPAGLIVRVTTHRGIVVIHGPDAGFVDPDWLPNGEGRIGCSVLHPELRAGVSTEARAILLGLVSKRSHDDIGDVLWDTINGGLFAWLGHSRRLLDPATAWIPRSYDPEHGAYVSIPNDTDPEAAAAIDRALGGGAA